MSENKKSIVVKKEDAENILNQIKTKKEEPIKEEPVVEEPTKEEVEEHIFKGAKKNKDTFAEKTAEAAAQAALKSVVATNSEIAMREAEKAYFLEKKNHMLNRCKNDKIVTRTVSKLLAPYLGKVYTFLFNGVPVTIYCDDRAHEYPEFIAKAIDKKLSKISESNTYKEIVDERLDQDTF